MFDFLIENRIDFIKRNTPEVSTAHETDDGIEKDPSKIIDDIATHVDPTKNKIYTQWATRQYHQGNFKQEDYSVVHGMLSDFHKVKSRLGEMSDINKHKDFSSLNDAVKPHLAAMEKEAADAGVESGRHMVHKSDVSRVYQLKTPEASQHFYGGGSRIGGDHTDWCISARSEQGTQTFNRYVKQNPETGHHEDPIHVIHIEGDAKSPYGIHSSQLMDRDNNPVDETKLLKKDPSLAHVQALHQYAEFRPIHKFREEFDSGKDHSYDEKKVWAKRENDPSYLHKIIDSKNFYPIEENPHLKPDHISKLIDRGSYDKEAVFNHKSASIEHKKKILDSHSDPVSLTTNKKTEPELLDHLLGDGSRYHYLEHVISHPNTSNETLEKIKSMGPWHEKMVNKRGAK